MLYLSDFIVYLWLLPVVMFIVIPLAMFIVSSASSILTKTSGSEKTIAEVKPPIGK